LKAPLQHFNDVWESLPTESKRTGLTTPLRVITRCLTPIVRGRECGFPDWFHWNAPSHPWLGRSLMHDSVRVLGSGPVHWSV